MRTNIMTRRKCCNLREGKEKDRGGDSAHRKEVVLHAQVVLLHEERQLVSGVQCMVIIVVACKHPRIGIGRSCKGEKEGGEEGKMDGGILMESVLNQVYVVYSRTFL